MPSFFFFNDTATTEIYTLSLHDALPISSSETATAPAPTISPNSESRSPLWPTEMAPIGYTRVSPIGAISVGQRDRKSTRLNSSHLVISYAVFCLKKKKNNQTRPPTLPYH